MELWIRSQDRMTLLNYSRIAVEPMPKSCNGEDKGYMFVGDHYYNLGEYKSKERALEVLDEIEERIMLINTINIAKDTDSLIACKNVLTEEKIKRLNYPYQMPEK